MNRTTSAIPREIAALSERYRSAAEQATRQILGEGRTVAKVEEIAAISAEYADREVAAWRDHPASPSGIDCRSGCNACCHAPIAATIPEAIRIAGTILDDWPDEALEALRDRLDRREEAHRGLSLAEARRLGHPCPLLDGTGACSIHPIRPLTCRGWNSLDASRCAAVLAEPDAGHEIPTDPVQRTIAGAIAAGARSGLEAGGLEHEAVDLASALRIVLEDPDAVDRWLTGEPAFEGTEMGEIGPETHTIGFGPPRQSWAEKG